MMAKFFAPLKTGPGDNSASKNMRNGSFSLRQSGRGPSGDEVKETIKVYV